VQYGYDLHEQGDQAYTTTWQLLISPYWVQDEIIELLSETKYELEIRMYQFTSKELLQVVKNLSILGVDVEMILENNTYGGSSKERDRVRTQLEPAWVEMESDEAMWTNFVHAKTMLIDDKTYIISTANLWYTWFWKNREYRFIWDQQPIADSLSLLFDKDMLGEKLLYKDIHPSLLICPLDCRKKIIDVLWSAKDSIRIQTQYIQDEEVVGVLQKKKLEWVEVRILVWEYQDDGWLEDLWTGVLIMDHVYVHAKNILVDDEIFLMWSMNLSTNALDNNREIWIHIDDPKAIASFSRQFESDRKETNIWK